MPKLLVLFEGSDDEVIGIAECIHEGARSVRFAEADIAHLPTDPADGRIGRARPLAGAESLADYDAIVLGAAPGEGAGLGKLLVEAGHLGLEGRLANKLGSVFPAGEPAATGEANPLWPLLAPMARYGMILVPPGYAGPGGAPEDRQAAGRRLGKRLIDIAAWITHARSHRH